MPGEPMNGRGTNGSFPCMPMDKAGLLADDVLEVVLVEQRRDWIEGKRTRAGEWLRQYPALAADAAQGAQVIYHEFALRQELGEFPDWEQYLREFPEHVIWLRQLRRAEQMVNQAFPPAREQAKGAPRFTNYDVLAEVGHGGMGIVYKARQKNLDRLVALKMIRAGEDAGEDERNRFQREAQAVACLHHPNIVQIYEVGEIQGQPFLSLEFVEGQSLAQRLKGTPVAARHAATLAEVLARAMHYAHGKGIIHRDLTPSNVLLAGTPETAVHRCIPKITDFGLAKRLDKAGETGSGTILGTPSYMAPELAESRAGQVDRRTDVYGLGVILYEMLTGRPPFRAESPLQTIKQVVEAEAARPRLLNPAVPRDLETICLMCLEKDPRRRYATAEALADDLERFVQGQPIHARPVGAIERSWRWCCRQPMIAGLVAALLLAVISGFSATLVQWRRAEANLKRETAARGEAEEHFTRLRDMVVQNIVRSAEHVLSTRDLSPVREAMLHDAESCLSFFLQSRDEDPELRTMLAEVLIQQGEILLWKKRHVEALTVLERARHLWAELLSVDENSSGHRLGYAMTCFYLEQAYGQQGRSDLAQHCFSTAFNLWRELARKISQEQPNQLSIMSGLSRSLLLSSEHEVSRRFEEIRNRLYGIGGGPDSELFAALLKVEYLCAKAEVHQKAQQSEDVLAAAREAASILAPLLPQTSLHRNIRYRLAHRSFGVSLLLRRTKMLEEALRLSEEANRTLREILHEASHEPVFLVALSLSWHEIAKIHWDLDHTEETVAACRNALAAQRELVSLAPTVPKYRQDLGSRYAQLGRKLCELERLEEAEKCFREQLALWPGDAAKHAEVLQDLQEWASKVGDDKKKLSLEDLQERQRYLDLYARLESEGTPAGAKASAKP